MDLGQIKLAFGITWLTTHWVDLVRLHRVELGQIKLAFRITWVTTNRHWVEFVRLQLSFGWSWPLESALAYSRDALGWVNRSRPLLCRGLVRILSETIYINYKLFQKTISISYKLNYNL